MLGYWGGGDGDDAGSGPPLDTPGGGGGPTGNNTPVGDPVNNCGHCNVPIYTAPVLEFEEVEQNTLINFLENLTPEQAAYWNGLTIRQKKNIADYLEENGGSNESLEFAEEALIALIEGGEVDFPLQIILDPSFKNNPCLNYVYKNMVKNSPTANNYLNNFDSTMSVANLKFASSNTLSSDTNAETSPPQNYLIKITFNSNNLDRPQLSIA